MFQNLAQSAANLMCKTFTGQTFDELELQQHRDYQLKECNRCIELRLAMLGYVFRNQSEMKERLELALNTNTDPGLRRVVTTDRSLMTLINLNQRLGNK